MDWRKAVAVKPQDLWFEAHGGMMHAHQWSHGEDYTVVFIHGSLANCVWWQPIAASLQGGISLSIDLSGHGLSAWDLDYSLHKHANEVLTLIEHYAKGKLYLVGHSYGGVVAGYVASQIDAEVILVDTPLHFSESKILIREQSRVYSTLEEIISRFKPLPIQPCLDAELLVWVAKRSIKKVPGGYTWQFDPKSLDRVIAPEETEAIKVALKGKATWWYGEHSPFVTDKAMAVAKELELRVEMIEGAYHAVMLDQPMILLEKIKSRVEK